MGAEITIDERAEILRFLGYPNWNKLAQSVQLGVPSQAHAEFLVRQAFARIAPESRDLIRRDLCELKDIECQLSESRSRLKANRLGDLHINRHEQKQLRRELEYWRNRLADDLGVYVNPWSNFEMVYGGNGNMSRRVYSG